MTPAVKREAVAHLKALFGLSERRACRIAGADRKMVRYQSRRAPDTELRGRLRDRLAPLLDHVVDVAQLRGLARVQERLCAECLDAGGGKLRLGQGGDGFEARLAADEPEERGLVLGPHVGLLHDVLRVHWAVAR